MRITVTGLGPGNKDYLLPVVQQALQQADVVIGYDYYFQFAKPFLAPHVECIAMPLGKEEERAIVAIEKAQQENHVVVIGSGDASIYSMAAIVYELVAKKNLTTIELETLPGVSAFLAAGSRLGAPLGHDFCCISLSDLMTPWTVIEKRIKGAAIGDFVTCLYNPRSKKRFWQLGRLQKMFLEHRAGDTPVAIVRQVTRPDESIQLTTLKAFNPEDVDMFCLVLIGNDQTFRFKDHLVTPRGYLNRKPHTGQEIQDESFRIVTNAIHTLEQSQANKWAITRIIHTTGEITDHQYYNSTAKAIENWHSYLANGGTIITDVTMVKSGITRAFTSQFGNQVHCYLNDEQATELAASQNITRSQAGIRLAIQKHPKALFVIGNAPTALMELTAEMNENGDFRPVGIIGVPVGFVNVIESKEQLMQAKEIDWVCLQGNKGGSNIAAAIVNACFTLPKAKQFITS